jgi:hypothetical protein
MIYLWYGARQCGSQSNAINLILRLFCGTCLRMTSDDNQTRPEHSTQTRNKHYHHGVGVARPSSKWVRLIYRIKRASNLDEGLAEAAVEE